MPGSSLRGIPTKLDGRHAFVYERALALIARETLLVGSVEFRKADLAARMGCCVPTLDRALLRLKREGYVEVEPRFAESGAQLSNGYRATEKGMEYAKRLRPSERAKAERTKRE